MFPLFKPFQRIAKSFSMQRTKFACTINFGLEPLFFSILIFLQFHLTKVLCQKKFFNLEKFQTDFIIILWDQETKTIITSYYGSKFSCYINVKTLKQPFDNAFEKLYKRMNTGYIEIKTCKSLHYLLNCQLFFYLEFKFTLKRSKKICTLKFLE